ncbi:metal ABC transporter substrate-binding protein [candidate division KSB1 bacterium]
MKIVITYFAVFLLFTSSVYPVDDKPLVITSTEDLYAIASAIGGDAVNVEYLAPGKANTHLIEVKPSYAVKLMKADAVIVVGLGLDRWMLRLIDNSRNRKIRPGTDGYIDASEGCNILDKGINVDRSMGDVHPQGNPHYLLHPKNGLTVAENLTKTFSGLFPENAAIFEENLKTFQNDFEDFNNNLVEKLGKIKGLEVVTYHKMWDYFSDFSGIELVSEIEPKPGIPPTAGHTQEVIEKIKQTGIKIIIRSPFYEDRTPKKIASETGAVVLTLAPQVGALDEVKDYFSLFTYNINKIYEAALGK